MRDHFSYLVDDDAGAFFQKAANRAATPAPRAPAPMAKTASATTPFEKIAARLDRDLEIIKVAGPCGTNGGMMRRADAYIDRVINLDADLSAEEFGEIFDKVATEAIMGDLQAAYAELTADVEPELHYVVERTLAKIGSDMTSLALLEKEAFLGALARGAGRLLTRGGGGGLAAGSAVAKGMAGRAAGRAANAVRGVAAKGAAKVRGAAAAAKQEFGVGRQAAMMQSRGATQANLAKARSIASAGGPNAARAADAAKALEKRVGVRPGAPASREFMEQANKQIQPRLERNRQRGMKAIEDYKAKVHQDVLNSTKPPATPIQFGRGKAVKSEAEAAKAQSDAADAARKADPSKPKGKPELSVVQGGKPNNDNMKGTGTDGPAPKPKVDEPDAPKPKVDADGPTPPPPGGADDKPPGFMDAWKKATSGAGWSGLSPAEKGALIRGGVTGAVVYRAVTGRGAITGGEGVV